MNVVVPGPYQSLVRLFLPSELNCTSTVPNCRGEDSDAVRGLIAFLLTSVLTCCALSTKGVLFSYSMSRYGIVFICDCNIRLP